MQDIENGALGLPQSGQPVPAGAPISTAPRFDVTGLQIVAAGNEFLVAGTHASVGFVPNMPPGFAALTVAPVVQLSLSPQALKDFAISLSDSVAKYESEWGQIETPFTRSRPAQ